MKVMSLIVIVLCVSVICDICEKFSKGLNILMQLWRP